MEQHVVLGIDDDKEIRDAIEIYLKQESDVCLEGERRRGSAGDAGIELLANEVRSGNDVRRGWS